MFKSIINAQINSLTYNDFLKANTPGIVVEIFLKGLAEKDFMLDIASTQEQQQKLHVYDESKWTKNNCIATQYTCMMIDAGVDVAVSYGSCE